MRRAVLFSLMIVLLLLLFLYFVSNSMYMYFTTYVKWFPFHHILIILLISFHLWLVQVVIKIAISTVRFWFTLYYLVVGNTHLTFFFICAVSRFIIIYRCYSFYDCKNYIWFSKKTLKVSCLLTSIMRVFMDIILNIRLV